MKILRQPIERLEFARVNFDHQDGVRVLENVDFNFPLNEFVWVQASAGSGRSILLQLLSVLLHPTQGHYLINGLPVTEMTFEEFLPYRLNIGYAFDYGGLISNRTLQENLSLPLLYHKVLNPKQAQKKVLDLIEHFEVTKYKDMRPSFVSGGMRKLFCLLRSLILEPELLVLDDPSVGLSQEMALKFFDHVQSLRDQGRCQHVFISSFDEKMMSLLPVKSIYIDQGLIHEEIEPTMRKVVNL